MLPLRVPENEAPTPGCLGNHSQPQLPEEEVASRMDGAESSQSTTRETQW